MMVTFVSQCEKKALKKTRRVLDAFANRIGDNTWQTVITQEGLNAVQGLLRKTATKSTAVSCHWIRSRARSQFLWAVGNKSRFNEQGFVPVNTTEKDILNNRWENNWRYLPLIHTITRLATLFHDWGKSSQCFQDKLRSQKGQKIFGDPLRHEWVSCLLLRVLFGEHEDDAGWLTPLSEGIFNEQDLKESLQNEIFQKPLKNLPPLAGIISWLVLSHHKLPNYENEKNKYKSESAPLSKDIFKRITKEWGYENLKTGIDINKCLDFPNGLPNQSPKITKQIKRWAAKALDQYAILNEAIESGSWRLILQYSRLSLMLGDYSYSSKPKADEKFQSYLPQLIANTDKRSKKKQTLDEHILGVAENAGKTVSLLPALECEMPTVYGIKNLKKKSISQKFVWQDKAVEKIKSWRNLEKNEDKSTHFGFFTVNMASTGWGKTFANAKIMRALSEKGESLRYVLALGLRTLTLQTGDEYRDRIGLKKTDLAVLIGSNAVLELHNSQNQQKEEEKLKNFGSESTESLLDEYIDYESEIPEDLLNPILTREKDRHFLYAPVLVATIDHIISATETKRGGKYMLPYMRLMSSDLVIDEVDDFDGKDLIAIGRLIHLAGMLGRKVMISSATIPPDMAHGYFHTYQQGWLIFAKSRGLDQKVGCAWVDEFKTKVQSVSPSESETGTSYYKYHNAYIEDRVENLTKQDIKRKGNICSIALPEVKTENGLRHLYFEAIQHEIVNKHNVYHQVIKKLKKKVSFGVVRVANIAPCVELANFLIECDWPSDVGVKIMPYHSGQVLLMRSAQEKHLDQVLKRNRNHSGCEHPFIENQLQKSTDENVIYILVATPVEEVGRDHDFDWAIVEPSSFRSIIQLGGRVLRHRERTVNIPNMALMQYNLKGYLQKFDESKRKRTPVFSRPGYETGGKGLLKTHNLSELLEKQTITTCINATPRIMRSQDLTPGTNLVDLEHHVISKLLTNFTEHGPESLEGWISQCWWLTALPQQLVRFRASQPDIKLFLVPEGDEEDPDFVFMEKDKKGVPTEVETLYRISHKTFQGDLGRIWFERDYLELLKEISKQYGFDLKKAALRFGEISIPKEENNSTRFLYSPQNGFVKR